MSIPERIDVHTHFVPPEWRNTCEEMGFGQPDGMPAIPEWSEEAHLKAMDDVGISKAIITITSPGTHLDYSDDALARRLTRDCNVFAAEMKSRRPDKFGFWASLPLPDIQGSLDEIAFALDELNADGFGLLTNYHGVYLGDKVFDPVFAMLDERKAIVHVHPTGPCMGSAITQSAPQAALPLPQYPSPMFEFLFEEARVMINLFLNETVTRYPNITYIISHCGGAFPPMVERFATFAESILNSGVGMDTQTVAATLQKQFYFDLAGFPFPDQLFGLLRLVDYQRILYGSDFPYTPLDSAIKLAGTLDKEIPKTFSEEEMKAIYHGNAARLLCDSKKS
ncbi:MAG: hypothetical protein FRX48_00382 [Lasallia pustulata]|uniref:6-methylsalicylate decarboxylase n=1 Tax=Lasallia pustulata TaxID=136370 RepID=A0A5M8Q0I3_9LECA|nr:MAG: hypothetical protein FRX48_00382 [Lasallia pustulata]